MGLGNNCELEEGVKPRKGKKKAFISEVFHDYCSSTSIHGIGYLGAEDKTLFEKIWWLIVFSLSVTACAYLIHKTWKKWNDNPVVVAFAQEQTPIWEIPFPAVTVCPINQLSLDKYDFGQHFQNRTNLTEEERKKFWDIALICNLREYDIEADNDTTKLTDEEFLTNIKSVAVVPYLTYVIWKNKQLAFHKVFFERITDEGLCYTFNSFNQEDLFTNDVNSDVAFMNHTFRNEGWEVDKGYSPHLNMSSYPYRTAEDGLNAGLSIVMGTYTPERDYACGLSATGFKVTIHNPAEIPLPSQQYFLVPESTVVAATVKPELIRTTRGLQDIRAHTRKCYLDKEKYLKFFKVYTQHNCRLECYANVTKEYCGCIPFYIPRDKNTAVCGYGKNDCLEEVENSLLKYEIMIRENKIPKEESEKITFQIFDECDCLPSCSSLQFTAETSQSQTHFFKTVGALGLLDDLFGNDEETVEQLSDLLKITKIDIFFKETQFVALYRSELYGQTDFLANCGGLLGLFMGFSFLSLVEVLYFLSIRVCCKIRYKDQHNDKEN